MATKTSAKKSTRTSGKTAGVKKAPAKKSAAKKAPAKKAAVKKAATRKYSPAAGKQVATEMHEFKRGQLKSGSNGRKVTSRKQAIAIALSEARKKGARVPGKQTTSR